MVQADCGQATLNLRESFSGTDVPLNLGTSHGRDHRICSKQPDPTARFRSIDRIMYQMKIPNQLSLDITRENVRRHLAFGYGSHRCVGARLAELQVRILIEEMAARRMRVNLAAGPVRVAQSFVNGYEKMMVEVGGIEGGVRDGDGDGGNR
jgi:hypothetical protein